MPGVLVEARFAIELLQTEMEFCLHRDSIEDGGKHGETAEAVHRGREAGESA
jgi:hypothetical protein